MPSKLMTGACAVALGAWVALVQAAAPYAADLQSIKQELESMRATQAGMQEEMRQIRAQLQRMAAPVATGAAPLAGTELSLEGAQIKGASQAKIVFVEYSDFQCPFCASYAANSYPQITRDYVDSGKMRYAFVNFPIESLHPAAFEEHVAATCAADQGRFWEMHDRLFANPKATDAKALADHAAVVGLDATRFRSCLEGGSHAADVRRTVGTVNALGIVGTPTFVIGLVGPDEKIRVAKVISGAKPYSVFKEAIDGVLATTVAWNEDSAASRPAVTRSGVAPTIR
jgi:protein-disulfide isomerase